MKSVYIVSAQRTAMGSYHGLLSSLSAIQLGKSAITGALKKISLNPETVQEVFMGNVCSANLGQAPARQAALHAGIDISTPCTSVNKVCASGMKAIMLAAQTIMLEQNGLVLAGGMESMSQVPYYVPQARFGYKYGDSKLVDGLNKDGLTNPYDACAMGTFGDSTAKKYNFTREAQDNFAVSSYKKSAEANQAGYFKNEIIPLEIKARKSSFWVEEDEEFKKVNFGKIPHLRPAFSQDGTVTAANASTMNDGAAALVLASEEKIKELNLKPLVRIISYADAAQAPECFPTTPVLAAQKALKRANLNPKDIDFFEVNEAFAVVPMVFAQMMNIDLKFVNLFGGAVSLGHPLGASGARIVTTLINILHSKKGNKGLATICNGGGGASALIIERL